MELMLFYQKACLKSILYPSISGREGVKSFFDVISIAYAG